MKLQITVRPEYCVVDPIFSLFILTEEFQAFARQIIEAIDLLNPFRRSFDDFQESMATKMENRNRITISNFFSNTRNLLIRWNVAKKIYSPFSALSHTWKE